MAVVGVLAQTDVSHDQQVQLGLANGFNGALNHSVVGIRLSAARIFFLRDAKQNNSGNAKLLDLAAFFEKFIHRLLRDAGHRADWIPYTLPWTNEHRINQTMCR